MSFIDKIKDLLGISAVTDAVDDAKSSATDIEGVSDARGAYDQAQDAKAQTEDAKSQVDEAKAAVKPEAEEEEQGGPLSR